jgi:hypothetical protein
MTKVNLVLTGAAVVFGVGCLVLFRELGTERNRVLALETQLTQLQRDLNRPQPAASSHEAALATRPTPQTIAAQPAAAPAATAANKPTSAEETAESDEQRQLLSDPAYRAVRVAEHRRHVRSQYPQLASELGWPEEEADSFLDFLAEQGVREAESMMNAGDVKDMGQRYNAFLEQQEKEKRKFLGEQRFQKWTEYVNSASVRELVSELRTQLATSSSPLREEQIKPLTTALVDEHQRHSAERTQNYDASQFTDETPTAERVAYMERRAELVKQSVARSREAGAMVLDSTQQRILDELLARQREEARLEVVSWRAFWEAEERQKAASRSR